MECLASETVWIKKSMYQEAEKDYFEQLSKVNQKPKNLHDSTTSKKRNKSENQSLAKKSESPRIDRKHSEAASKLNKNNLTDENRPEESKRKQHSKTDDLANASDTGEDIIVVEKNKPKKKKKKANNKNKSPEKPIEKQLIVECEEKIENDSVKQPKGAANCTLVSEIAKARQHIKNSLERMDGIAALAAPFENGADLAERVTNLEKMFADLQKQFGRLEKQFTESKSIAKSDAIVKGKSVAAVAKVEKKQEEAKNESENDDGVDLFASDSEDDKEADAIREQRLAAYKEKKSKKPALIAKSSVVFDIKPWDDSTDMKAMEVEIRKITADGLLWGASKLQLIAYGIKKLVLSCVVEDEKVSIDWLVEEIEKLEDYVQSVDIAAFNKI